MERAFEWRSSRCFRMEALRSANRSGLQKLITRGSLRLALGGKPDSISRTTRTIKLILIIKTMPPSACNGLNRCIT